MSFNISVKSIITATLLLFICGNNTIKAQDDFSDDASSAQQSISISGVVKDASTEMPLPVQTLLLKVQILVLLQMKMVISQLKMSLLAVN